MRLYAQIKLFIKTIKNTFVLHLISYLLLPIALCSFMGMVTSSEFDNPINTEITKIIISDNDTSSMSNHLVNFFEDNLRDIVEVTKDKSDASLEIIIPNNYEKNISNKKSTTIEIKKLDNNSSVATVLQNVIDGYHEKLYLNGLDNSNINNLFNKSSIETSLVNSNINQSSSEYYAITILAYLAMMFIMNNVIGSYLGESNGLAKRIYSLPISRVRNLFFDCIISWIYSFLFIVLYVLFYKYLGIAFRGNFTLIILLCAITSLFISTTSRFMSSFFSKKIGNILIYTLFIVQTIFGGMLGPVNEFTTKFIKLSPIYLINDMFTSFSVNNNLSSFIDSAMICILLSLVLFILSAIKEKYSWREF